MLAVIEWNPPVEVCAWNLPLIGRPILWYGVLFALGFFCAYQIFLPLLRTFIRDVIADTSLRAQHIGEMFVGYIALGAILGARWGDVLLYQSPHLWLHDPWSFLKIWEGGLASHGGGIGILVALFFLTRKLRKRHSISWTFLSIFDLIVIPTPLVAVFIRLGNFINQEIVGTPTTLPWGVLFLHPADGSLPVPRHPVQLYEATCYMGIFILLLALWKRKPSFRTPGTASGLFLILVFGVRFLLEFWKVEQSTLLHPDTPLSMGQILSLPFATLGLWLLARRESKASAAQTGP